MEKGVEQNQKRKEIDAIAAFDSLFTTNRIQMLKVLLPRLSPEAQGNFAVYIKFLELQYTVAFLQKHPSISLTGPGKQLVGNLFQGDNTDTIELLDELLPFSGPEERTKIQGMRNMLQNMGKMQEMMEMMQMLQEMFPEGINGIGGMNADNPMEMFSGMAGSDMASIFQMFGAGSAPDAAPPDKEP